MKNGGADSGKVDVVVLTKNSERLLERCLNSIYKNLPVNHLIIVDGYSTDSTLEIIERFRKKYGNVILLMDRGTRGSARMKGIREVRTEWFVFVDSDVVLCNQWYERAKRLMKDDVGGIWGIEILSDLEHSAALKLFLVVTRKIFHLRGGTHDLLVRREAVKDIEIPRDLHVFEDLFIKEWIEGKGYRVIATYDPYCIHYRPSNAWTLKGSINILVENLRFAPRRRLPHMFLAYGFYTAYVVYRIISKNLGC